jgi:plastocyanin
MHNNVIAIIVVTFIVGGSVWGIGNLINPQNKQSVKNVQGILLVAENNAFNQTNPDIHAAANIPQKLTIINKDLVRHDFIVDELKINTAYLSTEQQFTTAIASKSPGIFNYYCSLHPITMRGKIIIK